MSLFMTSFRPDFGRLVRLAHRERLLPPGDDLGYALHAILTACFADAAPKPFVLLPPGEPGGGPSGRLLAYGTTQLADLLERASSFADPAFAAPLVLDQAEAKAMPDFAEGRRLGFRIRLRPVIRTGSPRPGEQGKASERDVFDAAAQTSEVPSMEARARVYLSWLAQRLGEGGARLERGAMDSFKIARLLTRDRSGEASRARVNNGPDAIMRGTLTVTDPQAFAACLARGLGRHRAFGFGMLLLSPPD